MDPVPGMRPVLCRFREALPEFEAEQAHGMEWLAGAYARAEIAGGLRTGEPCEALEERLRRALDRFGCGPGKIAKRRTEVGDFMHADWERMAIYPAGVLPSGVGTAERMRFYAERAEQRVAELLCDPTERIQDLFHVTCTGYVSPSATQRAIARNGWWDRTRNTHVYHMGCYAAFPAVKLARATLAEWSASRAGSRYRADLVHTEICTLHLDPADHSPEQMVVQSLFADGHIKYSLEDLCQRVPNSSGPYRPERGLEVLGLEEMIVPESLEDMTWNCGDAGFRMTLSREVPKRIAGALPDFLHRLLRDLPPSERLALDRMSFAVHPGGPRIIDQVAEQLSLRDDQVRHSREVLLERGNMSSATIPHVWASCARDESLADGSLIVSLAFGPGLSIYGALMRKVELG